MFFEYDCAEEAIYELEALTKALQTTIDDHTIYARPSNPQWVARLMRVRELANELRAETEILWVEWARATGEIT